MLSRLTDNVLLRNPEYQSALVRMAIWLFSVVYIGLATWTSYYAVNIFHFYLLFGGYFVVFAGLMISVYYTPELKIRRYITLAADISATSLAIFLTKEAISPFYLLYIWIFVSYGTRYGKTLLMVASVLSVLAYNIVLFALSEWQQHRFEAFFFLLLLVMLPMYQYSLLRKLHEARQEAERANKARGDFLATMTHELRTPLTGVIGMTRLLQTTPLDSEQKDYLHSISSSAHLLRALIGDILDFSKIDANKLELESNLFDIRNLVISVASTLSTETQDKHVELLTRVDARVPREVRGDQLRISQILYNLMGNAIKFTDHGEVTLRLSIEAATNRVPMTHILLQVADTGIGIPEEKLDKIFDVFWQADVSNSRRFGGTGLGTTVARDLTQLMGGDISVRSQVGVGTTFSVRLPLLPDQAGSLDVKPPQLFGKRLLIFEINSASMQVQAEMAEELGMEVVSISNFKALNALQPSQFDWALVCDSLDGIPINLVLDRLEVIVEPQTPIIFAGYRGRNVGLPARISSVILKPFMTDQLMETVINQHAKPHAVSSGVSVEEPTEAPNSGIRILLAEDNTVAAKVFKTLLIRKGHRVILARDGDEALQAAQQESFHLAFIDLRMPHMDGLEFTRRYRAQESAKLRMPILALTANTAEDVSAECQEAGMDGFINKPVESEQLDSIIAQYVRAPDYSRASVS
ncbi:MAG: ATP-binding protein [Pseudomonadota bacterium]